MNIPHAGKAGETILVEQLDAYSKNPKVGIVKTMTQFSFSHNSATLWRDAYNMCNDAQLCVSTFNYQLGKEIIHNKLIYL